MDLFLPLIWVELGIPVVVCVTGYFLFKKSAEHAERAAEREMEFKKLQLEKGLFDKHPTVLIELDKLHRDYAMVAMVIKGGWIPFVIFFVFNDYQARVKFADSTAWQWAPLVSSGVIVVGLVAFYALVLRQAFKVSARISQSALQLTMDTKQPGGSI